MKNADLRFETFATVDNLANGQNGERRRGKDVNHELTRMNTNKPSRQGPLPDGMNVEYRTLI